MIELSTKNGYKFKTWLVSGQPQASVTSISKVTNDDGAWGACQKCLVSHTCNMQHLKERQNPLKCDLFGINDICSKCTKSETCYPDHCNPSQGAEATFDMNDDISIDSIVDTGDLIAKCKIYPNTYDAAMAISSRGDGYHVTEIKKKTGGKRVITAPHPTLKIVQKLILKNLLSEFPTHKSSHGSVKGKSVKSNAETHVAKEVIGVPLHIDIKDFFPSITVKRVRGLFLNLGFNERIAGALTALTTYKGSIPQGAPTSPWIANAICWRLDTQMMRGPWMYSRYVDDITITVMKDGRHSFKEQIARAQGVLYKAIKENGFVVNEKKTRLGRSTCGVTVMRGRTTIRNSKYKLLRAMVHKAQKDGLQAAAEYNGLEAHDFINKVDGLFAYYTYICGKRKGLERLKSQWDNR